MSVLGTVGTNRENCIFKNTNTKVKQYRQKYPFLSTRADNSAIFMLKTCILNPSNIYNYPFKYYIQLEQYRMYTTAEMNEYT